MYATIAKRVDARKSQALNTTANNYEGLCVTEDVYDKLRRLVSELREYGGLEAQGIAAHIGIHPANLSRFMSRDQATISYELGASIEALHAEHAGTIRTRKIEKLRQLMTELGYPMVEFK